MQPGLLAAASAEPALDWPGSVSRSSRETLPEGSSGTRNDIGWRGAYKAFIHGLSTVRPWEPRSHPRHALVAATSRSERRGFSAASQGGHLSEHSGSLPRPPRIQHDTRTIHSSDRRAGHRASPRHPSTPPPRRQSPTNGASRTRCRRLLPANLRGCDFAAFGAARLRPLSRVWPCTGPRLPDNHCGTET
jgi:hypothetical protein